MDTISQEQIKIENIQAQSKEMSVVYIIDDIYYR